jgi:hypothetical protein
MKKTRYTKVRLLKCCMRLKADEWSRMYAVNTEYWMQLTTTENQNMVV